MNQVDQLRHAYKIWHESRGSDESVWLALFCDTPSLRSLADGAEGMRFSAPRWGLVDVTRYFAEMRADWEMLFFHADEFVSEGERIVMLGRCGWRNRATNKEVVSPTAHFWRFEGGKAVEYLEFYDTAKALAAARPDPGPIPAGAGRANPAV